MADSHNCSGAGKTENSPEKISQKKHSGGLPLGSGKNRTELLWIVGNSASFSRRGTVPTNTTERNILKSESENDWHTAEIITALSGIAALFHDFGKSCLDFQKRLNKEERKANLIRHEWISVIMFLAFVNNEDDQSWLTRLAEGNFDKDWTDRIDKAIDKPFKNLPPLSLCCLLADSFTPQDASS